MMNTLDLTVDMMFFELRMNPWTVRNVLEHFVTRYSYEDEIFDPAAPDKTYPGASLSLMIWGWRIILVPRVIPAMSVVVWIALVFRT